MNVKTISGGEDTPVSRAFGSATPASCPAVTRRREFRRHRGAALVLVLLLLAVLGLLAAEFLYELRIHAVTVRRHEDKVRARYVARAGQHFADGLLSKVSPEDDRFCNQEMGYCFFKLTCTGIMNAATVESSFTLSGEERRRQREEEARDRDGEEEEAPEGLEETDNCGAWSLALPYSLDNIPIEIEFFNEQAKLNLNALVTSTISVEDQGAGFITTVNLQMLNTLYELFRLQAMRHEIQISETDLRIMIERMAEFIKADPLGNNTFQGFDYGDKIVPLKKGPFDTIEEIKLLPDLNDDLFNAVKDFITVYPAKSVNPPLFVFDQRVAVQRAPVEVIYAMLMASNYNSDGDLQSAMDPEKAFEAAVRYVKGECGTAPGGASKTPGANAADTAASYNFKRELCPEMQNAKFTNFTLPPNSNPRYYTIRSSALAGEGFETVITRVLKVQGSNLTALFYRED